MNPFIGLSGAYKSLKPFLGLGGAHKSVQGAWIGVGGVWKQFFVNLSAVITGGGPFAGGPPVWATPVFTCTPSGGTAPYNYLWAATDPDANAVNPISQSTVFFSSTGATTAISCTVTDANGAIAIAVGST